jgi:xylan 1,4-beta-xylosidase
MIEIFPQKHAGFIRPLNGVNRGPVDDNWGIDLRPWFKRWNIPNIRTHDCVYNAFDTVDLHHIFPNPEADPDVPANYRFALTDDLLGAIRDSGAEIYFRLGETIEHQPTMQWGVAGRWKPNVLAKVCLNIVRHYNDGWNDGFSWGIRYWEFWNEPDGPKNWSGNAEGFYDYYQPVAVALKTAFPEVKVGGAGFGWHFCADDHSLRKPWRDFVLRCAREKTPLDFVSWHRYAVHWDEITTAAAEVREFLDNAGLQSTESHLGEWSYRPYLRLGDKNYAIFGVSGMKRYDLCRRLGLMHVDSKAAALVFGSLSAMQDSPLDVAQYYCADTCAIFGLFDKYGLPNKKGLAFEAFAKFLTVREPARRIRVVSDNSSQIGLGIISPQGTYFRIGVACLEPCLELQFSIVSDHADSWVPRRAQILDDTHEWQEVEIPPGRDGITILPISAPGIAVIDFSRAVGPNEPFWSEKWSEEASENQTPGGPADWYSRQ